MVNTITKVYKSWIATMSNDELDNKFKVLQERAEKIKREVYDIGQEYLKLIDEFELANGVFDWGLLRPFTWNIKVEYDNIINIMEEES